MIILCSGGGSQEFRIVKRAEFYFDEQNLLSTASQLLMARGNLDSARTLAGYKFEFWEATNGFGDVFYVMSTNQPIAQYEHWRLSLDDNSENRRAIRDMFKRIMEVLTECGLGSEDEGMYLRFIVCNLETVEESDEWREKILGTGQESNNQGLFEFPDAPKISHQRLNFRSKTEIRIFESLIRNKLLVMPLPVAVLGSIGNRREPDFVVVYQGRVGILEIHGESWHPVETAAKEAERRRMFRTLGVAIYEVFDARKCWSQPDAVVAEFLRSFDLQNKNSG